MEKTTEWATALWELKNYLIFLKDSGYSEIPAENIPVAAAEPLPFKTAKELIKTKKDKSAERTPVSAPGPVEERAPEPGSGNAAKLLEEIRREIGDCTRCKLSQGRTNIVFGSGNPSARLVFVGEGPGADEDAQGLPFVGRAGKKLTEIIEKGMGLSRERDTYICNIVKCRPPGNRDPEPDEIAACKPFLLKQLQAINPKVAVALGKPAASTLLERPVAITKERGTWHEFKGIKLMLTFHPAYLLRFYTVENRRSVLEDMKKALSALRDDEPDPGSH